MSQLISNVLMQPKPTDAGERPLTLVEKLKQLSDKYLNQYKYYGGNADLNCSSAVDEAIAIVKQHQAESGWVSVNERLPERVKLCFILAKSDTRGLCYHLGVCIDDIWFDYLDRKIQDTAIFWQYANIPQPPSEVQA